MTAGGFDPTSDVVAPLGAHGWSVSREDLAAADREGRDVVYRVPSDGVLRDVVGAASIAALMLLDTRTLALRREVDDLRDRLLDVAEAMVATLAARSGSAT